MLGSTLAHYEITRLLGSGGMGDVYEATDLKLGRLVALKLLPEPFLDDAERIARLRREARLLAALSHPNIAGIHGLEESNGRHFLVMELVSGETLAERIRRGAIPVDDALSIARQIADALEAAHDRAIVHRDLKPANVKITTDDRVKVLDFGLAKAFADGSLDASALDSPTVTAAATQQGVILGTAPYMSPEQAKGAAVDRRTDLFAFGAVLYEMLTGRPAFAGDTFSDTLAAVIRAEPDWTALPSATPAAIRRLLRRCLQKERHRRLDTAGAARIEIDDAQSEPDLPPMPPRPRVSDRRLPWILVAAQSVLALALAIPGLRSGRATPEARERRLEISTPPTPLPLHLALSPDGRSIVFVAAGDGPPRLWLRTLDRVEARPMAGTEGAEYPFWSADSRSVGFFATGKLYSIEAAGGPPRQLAIAPSGTGGACNADGTILFTPNVANDRIYRIASSGGEPVPVTATDPARTGVAHHFPWFLPDQRRFLYYGTGPAEGRGLYLASLDGDEPKRLSAAADTFGAYIPPGRVAFIRQGTLLTQELDLTRGELVGDPVTLAEGTGYDTTTGWGGFSVAAEGTVAYRAGLTRRQLVWYDRTGTAAGVVGTPDTVDLTAPALSPDGGRLAVARSLENNWSLWIFDLVRGGSTPFTFDADTEIHPVWSPDGSNIAFESSRQAWKMRVKPSTGLGTDQVLLDEPDLQRPQDWSKDGRFLVYDKLTSNTGHDIWVLDIAANTRKATVLVSTAAEELNAQFSPDGRWIAYETNESGQPQIVVQSFPTQTRTWPISISGGVQPRWRADGRELYFIAPDRKMMGATITSSGPEFQAGTPVPLFPTHVVSSRIHGLHAQYVVSRDGRVLINETVEDSVAPITLVLNWKPR
jgi:serine/threonine protein kinase/Tol biopolymer transport system component